MFTADARTEATQSSNSPLNVHHGLLRQCQGQCILLRMFKELSEGSTMLAITRDVVVQPMPRWMLQDLPKLEAVTTDAACQQLDHGR